MRIFWGAILGTIISFGFFGWFAVLNGTPVPSAHTPAALLAYPTGSWWLTLIIAWVIYTGCLLLTRKHRY